MRMFTYAEVLRIALQSTHTTTCPDTSRLTRTLPAVTAQSAKTTGMVIDGPFEMFRDRNGQMRFIGQDGQYICK